MQDTINQREKLYISLRLVAAFVGGGMLINGYVFNAFFVNENSIGRFSIFVAALVLSFPVFYSVIRDFLYREEELEYADVLVSIAIVAAFIIEDHLVAALVPLLMTLGHIIEDKSIVGAKEAITSLEKLSTKKATKIVGTGEIVVDTETLVPGDIVLLKPGDMVPSDGTVIEGYSSIDQSTITGESIPVEVSEGDGLYAGTSNLSGALKLKISKTGRATTIGRVQDLIAMAEDTKAPIVKLLNKYAAWYLPFILMLAAIAWFYTGDIYRAIAILIIACPCAFVLASPTAMIASITVLTRYGILIKNTKFLEIASQIETVSFDKTGTITFGELSVTQVDFTAEDSGEQKRILEAAYALSRDSRHPASKAISRFCENEEIPSGKRWVILEQHGKGIESGAYLLGKRVWLEEHSVLDLPDAVTDSEVLLSENGRFVARFHLLDVLKPNIKEVFDKLRQMNVKRIILMTGDKQSITEKTIRDVHFDQVYSECLPEDKFEKLKLEKENGDIVCMVGDGINDSLALASGDISIAIGAMGSEIAINASDVAFMDDNLNRLPILINLSSRTIQTINRNLGIAVLYSAVVLVLSFFGFISPILAALMHNGGALLVILNSGGLLKHNYQT